MSASDNYVYTFDENVDRYRKVKEVCYSDGEYGCSFRKGCSKGWKAIMRNFELKSSDTGYATSPDSSTFTEREEREANQYV